MKKSQYLLRLVKLENDQGTFNPDIAAAVYYGLQTLAATLVSRFCYST
jgi:hypothetical protein